MTQPISKYDLDCEVYMKQTGKDPEGLREPDHPDQRDYELTHTSFHPSHFHLSDLLTKPEYPVDTNEEGERGEGGKEENVEGIVHKFEWVWVED